ncbi:MAG: DNA polymerase III subunit beta [Bacilli bacterium]|nr:DNA polymerase III subunit beta [Bacilli bacterium]
MKFKIKQNILMEHLNYAIKGISNKNLIPILNCIKFELTQEGLNLMSTDNDIAIKTFIDKKDIEEVDTLGEVVISGKYIYEIIRKLPNTIINIEEAVDSRLYIYTDSSSFYLNSNLVSDFPQIDLNDHKSPIVMNQKVLKTIFAQTSFATSTQETRPILTGINFKINENKMECTATDSYRLAKKIVEINETIKEDINVTIPTKNLGELVKMFNDDEDTVELHIFNNKIIFKFNNIIMLSSLINGTYPDTSKLIPESFSLHIQTKFRDIYGAIDRASLLTNESEKNTIRFESKQNGVVISSNIPEIGNVEEKIQIQKQEEGDIHISFSSKYMMDALKTIEAEDVTLCFNSEIQPIIIKSADNDHLIQLILPIKTY